MSFEFHTNKKEYFRYQFENSKNYIVPFVKDHLSIKPGIRVLEIGCAEAGVLKAFTDLGCICVGIELSPARVEHAKHFMVEEIAAGKLELITKNIYDIEPDENFKFDLVILKDVIEHIHDQARFMAKLHDFLSPGGKVFFGFPPWYMPFGGHQQVAKNKIASKLPYYHLLPMPIYKLVLKAFGEGDQKIENMLEIKETGISIERFERICKREKYKIIRRTLFLFNPIYIYKFGVKARKQFPVLRSIPFLRNFFTTCAYYLIEEA